MIVTQILELSKARSKVYIDQEFAFVLYKGELRLYHVREGQEITREDYSIITQEVLPKRAKLRAMNLLTKREYTEEQLRKKLHQGFYPEPVIEQAIEYVRSYHYIDDSRYALSYINFHESSRSRRRIENDLQNKGVHKDTIQRAWMEWEEMGGKRDELSMIQKLLEKKRYDAEHADYKEKQRIYAFLMRRGFQSDLISKALKL